MAKADEPIPREKLRFEAEIFTMPRVLMTNDITDAGIAAHVSDHHLAVAPSVGLTALMTEDKNVRSARPSRMDWATLLARTWQFDVRECTRCGGRLEVRAVVTKPESVKKLLNALMRGRAPPRLAA